MHFQFCHDYSAVNFKGFSPVPMFLHSIMGVGTNFFPMTKDKLPTLINLLSPADYIQIEAFPSILRLLTGTSLLTELHAESSRLHQLSSIQFHRYVVNLYSNIYLVKIQSLFTTLCSVLDNASCTLSGENFIVQLNYQLMHLLDFLPAASWLAQLDDGFLNTFIELHGLLTRGKSLKAKVDFDLTSGESTPDGLPVTIGSIVKRLLPMSFKRKVFFTSTSSMSINFDSSHLSTFLYTYPHFCNNSC